MAAPSDKLVRHSLLLLVAAQVANASNLLFHMATGRLLSIEEYGLLVFMLNMVMIVAMPLDALRSAMAHYAAFLLFERRAGDTMRLAGRWMLEMVALAGLVLLIGFAGARGGMEYFNLSGRAPLYMIAGVLSLSLFPPLFAGILQGVQSFFWMSAVQNLWCLIRLAVGVAGLLLLGRTAVVAMGGFALGMLASAVAGSWAVRRFMRGRPRTTLPIEGPRRYVGKTLMVFAGFAVLANVDIILAKRFLPDAAGYVAMAGTIARTVLYLPMPIAAALFPKVASSGTTTFQDRRVLGRALVMTLAIVAGASGVCLLWPQLPLRILYGIKAPDAELVWVVRAFVAAFSPLPVVFMLANFEMAQRRFAAPLSLLPLSGVYVLGVAVCHGGVQHLAGILAFSSVLSLLVLLVPTLRLYRSLPRGAE